MIMSKPLALLACVVAAFASESPREYKVVMGSSGYTWEQARDACGANGLAIIVTTEDAANAIATRAAAGQANKNLWIALNDKESEGNWKQEGCKGICQRIANKECKNLDPWVNGEPNDYKPLGGEDCGHMYAARGGQSATNVLNDLPCAKTSWDSQPMGALCNLRPPRCGGGDKWTPVLEIDSVTPSKSNLAKNIPITDDMRVEFEVTIKGFPSGWANILHCGSSNSIRMPGIWLHPDSDNAGRTHQGFHISNSVKANWNPWINPQPALVTNRKYKYVQTISQDRITVQIDGVTVHDKAKTEHQTYASQPCYFSDPWYTAANVVLKNVKISTGQVYGRPQAGQDYIAIAPENGQAGYTWQQAKAACEEKGTSLASIVSRKDMARALEARKRVETATSGQKPSDYGDGMGYYWVGLNDLGTEGTWVYVDGADCNGDCRNLEAWVPGEPNDYKPLGGEDCGHIYGGNRAVDSALNDLPCDRTSWGGRRMFALCNSRRPTSPQGYYLVPNSAGFTWQQANAACGADGLAIINTRAQLAIAGAARGSKSGEMCWTALNDINAEGTWKQDGAPGACKAEAGKACKNLDTWAANEPNNAAVATGGEDCGQMYEGSNNNINDLPCSWKKWRNIPINALCNDWRADAGAQPQLYYEPEPIDNAPEPEFQPFQDYQPQQPYPAMPNDDNVVFRFTSEEMWVFALVLANIVTVAISAYLCCRRSKPAEVQYAKVDVNYTTEEECVAIN